MIYKGFYDYKNDVIWIDKSLRGYRRWRLLFHEKIHRWIFKRFFISNIQLCNKLNYLWDILDNHLGLIKDYHRQYEVIVVKTYGGGGKKGGSETTVDYHWAFALSEIICYEKPLITFTATLGNVILLGDGVTMTAQIPSYWMKKYFYTKGYGYLKTYPYKIKLYKNSLTNELIEDTDFTYDNATGEIVFLFLPTDTDIIAGDWTYDESEKEETTFFADFAYNEIYKRVGFKYFKYQDDGLNTYTKCAIKAKHLLSEMYKPIVYGSYDIVFNPKVKIGNSIYIRHIIPNVKRIFFIDKIRESHSKTRHTLEVSGLSFPEIYDEIRSWRHQQEWERLEFTLPENFVTFIGTDYHRDGFYLTGKAKRLDDLTQIDTNYEADLRLKVTKNDEFKDYPALTGFAPNMRDIAVFRGKIYQWYDIAFTNAEGTYTEFSDSDTFFAQRLVTFQLYSATNTYETTTNTQTVFIGRKQLDDRGYSVAPYAGGDHIVFLDEDDGLWLSDYRFATKKIIDLPSGSAIKIDLIGSYTHAFVLLDLALYEIDVENDTLTSLGNLGNDYPLRHPERIFHIDIDDYKYIFSHANISGTVGNYNNYLDIVKYKLGNKVQVNMLSETGVTDYIGGVPYMFDKWVFWGKWAWDLYTGSKHDHLSSLLPSGIASVYYTSNAQKTIQYACVCMDQNNSLTANYGTGKKWRFYKRPSNDMSITWAQIGTGIEFTEDMTIIPIGVGQNLVLYLKGSDLQSVIHPDADCGIGILNESDELIDLKLAKVEGESDSIYNNSFFLNNRLFLNWKDLTEISQYENIGVIDL